MANPLREFAKKNNIGEAIESSRNSREMKKNDSTSAGGSTSTLDPALVDHLWKTIQRFDVYFGATNAKAAFLIAFNSAIFGGILLRWQDVMKATVPGSWEAKVAGIALVILGAGCILSTTITLKVVSPFLRSPRHPGVYHSSIFFGHVAEHENGSRYMELMKRSAVEDRVEDLANQAHVLAIGLNRKFADLQKAIVCIICVQLPSLFAVIVSISIASI